MVSATNLPYFSRCSALIVLEYSGGGGGGGGGGWSVLFCVLCMRQTSFGKSRVLSISSCRSLAMRKCVFLSYPIPEVKSLMSCTTPQNI